MLMKQLLLSAICIVFINEFTSALELTLDPEVTGDRTTCGVLRCVEEGGPPRVSRISNMTVYKSTGPWSKRGRTSIASVSETQASTSSFSEGVKVDGTWMQRRAEITLHLVEPDDCRQADFSCEVRSVDAEGLERVSYSQVGRAGSTQYNVPPHRPAQKSCFVGLGSLQLNAILQETFSALENRIEDGIGSLMTSIAAIAANQTRDILSNTRNSTENVIDSIGEAFNKRECIRFSMVEKKMSKALESDYHVVSPQNGAAQYLCDGQTDGGGWVVIQRRVNGVVNFYRDWVSYKEGFGTLDTEFWMGNERIHALTAEAPHELMVGLVYKGEWKYARYNLFRVGNEKSGYKLEVGGYSGSAGDSLMYHNNMKFSTYDRDNDRNSGNCAYKYTGAWWYNTCNASNLNGKWGEDGKKGPRWASSTGSYPAVFTEMKIRRK